MKIWFWKVPCAFALTGYRIDQPGPLQGALNFAVTNSIAAFLILTGIGLYWLGGLQPGTSAVVAFAAATVFGIGKSYFWPTMIGVTAEQFPRGGALLISIMGGTGMLSVAVALPIMGARIDQYGPGAALKMIAALAVILTVIFGGLWGYFKLRGGYRVVHISAAEGPQSLGARL